MTEQHQGRILMLSTHGYVSAEPELGAPDTGGQVVFVLELAKRFSRLGYKVDVVTRRFEDQPAEDRINDSLRVWRIPFGGRAFIPKEHMHDHIGDFITNLLNEVNKQGLRYDVVNSHYWDAGWAGQRIAEELQIPHVHTPHSLGWWKRQDMAGPDPSPEALAELEKTYRFEERMRKEFLIYRNCDHIIATSHHQVDLLNEQYDIPRDHVSMIPPGIDEHRYTPVQPSAVRKLQERFGFEAHDVYCVGRAAENKGYDLLIRALPVLRRLVPDARLVLAPGAHEEADRELIEGWKQLARELGVGEQVKWLGYVEDDQMADHYRAAPVFALPSRYEPFGMTAVEAMACGTPTVLTVHGGLYDQVNFGTHALYADPQTPEEFAAMLALPLRYENLRERLVVEGARFARRQFGWTGIARRTLTVFDHFKGRYEELDPENQSLGEG